MWTLIKRLIRIGFFAGVGVAAVIGLILAVLLIAPPTSAETRHSLTILGNRVYAAVARRTIYRNEVGDIINTAEYLEATDMHARGYTGEGITVAVFDTGIDSDHIDLAGKVVHQACFLDTDGDIDGVGICPDGSDRQIGVGSAEDDAEVGHGTHMAGIIASSGNLSDIGLAPDVELVSIKILNRNTGYRFVTDVLDALEYIAEELPEVDVINLSIFEGDVYDSVCDDYHWLADRYAEVFAKLAAADIIIFGTTGNDYNGQTIGAPACFSSVVAVGATGVDFDGNEFVAGRGNTNAITEMVLPGESIISTVPDDQVSLLGGTSMATAHATGCAALLLSTDQFENGQEVIDYMKSSPIQLTDRKNGLTFPRPICSIP